MANDLSPRPDPRSKDADLARSFGVGCAVLLVVYLCGSGVIAYLWLNR